MPLLILSAVWLDTGTLWAAQRVSFKTDDGVTIGATWYEPSVRPAPAVILVHMLQRSRRDWEGIAPRLAAAGIGALAIDLRGHGESQGSAQNQAAMMADVKAARRYLGARLDVIPGRVGLAGASLGATLVTLAAADDPTIRCVALLSPAQDYRGLRLDAAARKMGTRPMLLVASDEDAYAMRTARDLQKGSATSRELLMLNGAGHGTVMLTRSPDLEPALVDWFRKTLL